MRIILRASMIRAAVSFLAFALVSFLLAYSISWLGFFAIIFATPAVLSAIHGTAEIYYDNSGNIVLCGRTIRQADIEYTYDDPGYFFIKTKNTGTNYLFAGFMSISPNGISFSKFYLKRSDELESFFKPLDVPRRRFCFGGYFIISFRSEELMPPSGPRDAEKVRNNSCIKT